MGLNLQTTEKHRDKGGAWRIRAIAVALVAFALIGQSNASATPPRWGDITGPVTATSLGVRIPQTWAEVATLTTTDDARMRAAVQSRSGAMMRLVEQGALTVQGNTTAARLAIRRVPGSFSALPTSHLYADAQCGVFWTDYPGSGTQVWGGGWTRSNASATLTVSMLGGAKFYKDGVLMSVWGVSGLVGTNAERYSAQDWRWWYETTHTYFTEANHSIQNTGDGSYDWGPAYCGHTEYK